VVVVMAPIAVFVGRLWAVRVLVRRWRWRSPGRRSSRLRGG